MPSPTNWFEEGWNNLNEEAIDKVFSPDLIAHGLSPEGALRGSGGFREFYRQFREQFTDIKIETPVIIKEGDYESALTHVLLRHKATGQTARFSGICLVRIKDGKVVEAWNQYDFDSMNKQLAI